MYRRSAYGSGLDRGSTKALAPQPHGRRQIGQHSGPATTASAITLKHLAGKKQRRAWNPYELNPTAGKHAINVLDTRAAVVSTSVIDPRRG